LPHHTPHENFIMFVRVLYLDSLCIR